MINNAKFIKLMHNAAIQDVGFRGLIKNILNKNDLKGIIYNVEDGNVNILIWGNENVINSSLTQIQTEAKQKNIVFKSQIKDLSVDISPPSGVFIIEDTEKDKDRKFDKGLAKLDKIDNNEIRNRTIDVISSCRGTYKEQQQAVRNIRFITTLWAYEDGLDDIVLKNLEEISLEATMNSDIIGEALAAEIGTLAELKIHSMKFKENLMKFEEKIDHINRHDEEFVMRCINLLENIKSTAKEYDRSNEVVNSANMALKNISEVASGWEMILSLIGKLTS